MRRSLILVFLLVATACAGSQRAVIQPMASAGEGADFETLVEHADAVYAAATSEASLRKAIELYEAAYALEQQSPHVLDRLSLAYYQLASAYAPSKAKRIEMHERGKNFGMKRLEMHPGYREVVEEGGAVKEAVARISELEYIHAMLFTASNWAWSGELQGLTKVAFDIPKVKAMFERAMEIDADYYCAGPTLLAASYYAKAGAFGGDMEKSYRLFSEATSDPQCLYNKVLFAEFYALQLYEQELYHRLLTEVVEYDGESPYILENDFAKQRAAEMLAEEAEIF